ELLLAARLVQRPGLPRLRLAWAHPDCPAAAASAGRRARAARRHGAAFHAGARAAGGRPAKLVSTLARRRVGAAPLNRGLDAGTNRYPRAVNCAWGNAVDHEERFERRRRPAARAVDAGCRHARARTAPRARGIPLHALRIPVGTCWTGPEFEAARCVRPRARRARSVLGGP